MAVYTSVLVFTAETQRRTVERDIFAESQRHSGGIESHVLCGLFTDSQQFRRKRRPKLCCSHSVLDRQADFETFATQRVIRVFIRGSE